MAVSDKAETELPVGKMDYFVQWFEGNKKALVADAYDRGLVDVLQTTFLAGWRHGVEHGEKSL